MLKMSIILRIVAYSIWKRAFDLLIHVLQLVGALGFDTKHRKMRLIYKSNTRVLQFNSEAWRYGRKRAGGWKY